GRASADTSATAAARSAGAAGTSTRVVGSGTDGTGCCSAGASGAAGSADSGASGAARSARGGARVVVASPDPSVLIRILRLGDLLHRGGLDAQRAIGVGAHGAGDRDTLAGVVLLVYAAQRHGRRLRVDHAVRDGHA